jgi:hypothetical protein
MHKIFGALIAVLLAATTAFSADTADRKKQEDRLRFAGNLGGIFCR